METKEIIALLKSPGEQPERAIRLSAILEKIINLHLSKICLIEPALIDLCEALKTNTSLTALDLGCREIEPFGAAAVAAAIINHPYLISLQFRHCNIEPLSTIADTFQAISNLRTIHLENNKIGDFGAIAIANAVSDHPCLISLHLRTNNIGPLGASAIAAALQGRAGLRTLDLCYNHIGDLGASDIADGLKFNTTLTRLSLGENHIHNSGAIALTEALKVNISLKKLDLYGNNIGDDAAIAFAEILKDDSSLTSLYLGYNIISDNGAQVFVDVLKANYNLHTLALLNKNIQVALMDELDASCNRNRQMIPLRLALLVTILHFGTSDPISDSPQQTQFAGSMPSDLIIMLVMMVAPEPEQKYAVKLLNWVKEHPPSLTKDNQGSSYCNVC